MGGSGERPEDKKVECSVVSLVGPAEAHRVLFVDDEDAVRRAFRRTMSRGDIEVVTAGSAEEALEILRTTTFGVVISDFHMPGIDGVRFLAKVNTIDPHAVRILVSGKIDLQVAAYAVNQVGLFGLFLKPWDPNELRFAVHKALEQRALSVENRRLAALLSHKCDETMRLARNLENDVQSRTTSLLIGMINALDLRDTETHWHSRRVALYARRLAERLSFEGEDLLTIERGSLLHDVGKIGVSDTILLKPGKLTEEEWVEMRKHSEYGYRILEGIDFLGQARELVHEHHERWDGNGYPRHLAERNIYVGARIFGIIDAYDAITSDRPYRKGSSHDVANAEISRMKGTQFDPEIVDAWFSIPAQDLEAVREIVVNDRESYPF
ncbi:MAG: HD domain-containing protein [Deltaproteobacteria bacterium]|nr:HD domain-containing protein [Deltaproteobacteria bacterium]